MAERTASVRDCSRQCLAGRNEEREPIAPIHAAARDEPHAFAIAAGEHPEAVVLDLVQPSKYPPAEPGALVWEPLKAADPGGFGLAFHLRRGMSHEVSKHPHFIWYLIFAPQLVVA